MKIVDSLVAGLSDSSDPFASMQRMQLTGLVKRAGECEIGVIEATKDVQVALMGQITKKGDVELLMEEEHLFAAKLKTYAIELTLYKDELTAYNLTSKSTPPPCPPIRPIR